MHLSSRFMYLLPWISPVKMSPLIMTEAKLIASCSPILGNNTTFHPDTWEIYFCILFSQLYFFNRALNLSIFFISSFLLISYLKYCRDFCFLLFSSLYCSSQWKGNFIEALGPRVFRQEAALLAEQVGDGGALFDLLGTQVVGVTHMSCGSWQHWGADGQNSWGKSYCHSCTSRRAYMICSYFSPIL